jgi:hypothetical protein
MPMPHKLLLFKHIIMVDFISRFSYKLLTLFKNVNIHYVIAP